MNQVSYEFGCWIFTGMLSKGYGRIRLGGRESKWSSTHRLAYAELVGAIPDGMHLDHLCRTPACCNPLHLEPVSLVENLRRGLPAGGSRFKTRTHCSCGAELVRRKSSQGYMLRVCPPCIRLRRRRRAAVIADVR